MDADAKHQVPPSSGRDPAALDDEVHDLVMSILEGGRSLPPKKQRSRSERSAFRKRRNCQVDTVYNPFTGNTEKRLVHSKSGKIALKKTEVTDTIRKAFIETKGEGAKKIFHTFRREFIGLGGEHGVQSKLNSLPEKQRHRPVFSNRPALKSVKASRVMSRNQTDIVDLRKVAIRKGEITYRYVLSVLDVFSRFVFLEPLTHKSGLEVARVLERIYSVVGPPRVLQSDQGKEFTSRVVRKTVKRLNCRMVYSSAYHPQSQGKASILSE